MNMQKVLENQEFIDLLVKNGHGKLVEMFLLNEHKAFTRGSNRLNKSASCRLLSCKMKQFESEIKACRDLLAKDYLEE